MELLMGNEAIAMGALRAGVGVVAGYPGTPSTEVLETVAKRNPGHVKVQWSVNEKNALEVGVGAAYAGARAMVTMKQVGLNVASDPLMCVNYVGVKGGLVILVADDPGPISSQTEQDTRAFGRYARIPVLDPASPEEAFDMAQYAFELSEHIGGPVILRPTTRVCHSCASIEVGELPGPRAVEGFVKDPRWVIFPRLSYQSKIRLCEREAPLAAELARSRFNAFEGAQLLDIKGVANPCETCEVARQPYFTRNGSSECVDCEKADIAQRIAAARRGVACGGVTYAYVREALKLLGAECPVLRIGTPYPFPDELARDFMKSVSSVLVLEELDPVIEDALHMARDRYGLSAQIVGKRDGAVPVAGELSADECAKLLGNYLGVARRDAGRIADEPPALPVRPPVLCAGCPHRGSFYAVKVAMKGRKAVFCGDIGCYTLGNAAPLDMTDTCLCMGAGITIAQGLTLAQGEGVNFAFVGDSTFFHSGITGVINAVYNKTDMVLCVLDNSTTAMTGHQAHPGMGRDASGNPAPVISIRRILEAIGVSSIECVNPFNLKEAVAAVRRAADGQGVRALLFEAPCVALPGKRGTMRVDADKCVGCHRCIRELGCPALSVGEGGKAEIAPDMCTACGLCAQVCPVSCIAEVK